MRCGFADHDEVVLAEFGDPIGRVAFVVTVSATGALATRPREWEIKND
jgi:hypothetical protein